VTATESLGNPFALRTKVWVSWDIKFYLSLLTLDPVNEEYTPSSSSLLTKPPTRLRESLHKCIGHGTCSVRAIFE